MLMHESIVMRQLRGAAPPQAASPAALSLVTAALERMAAADHTAMHSQRPAVDSFSRYEQACAALVAAPEAPPLAASCRRAQDHCTQRDAAATASPAAQPMASGTTGVCGNAEALAGCTPQSGTMATQQGCDGIHRSGEPAEEKLVARVAERIALGGSAGSTPDAAAVPSRHQMITEPSRQNFLRLFGQDDLDLAEDLAFSCAAFEDGSSCL